MPISFPANPSANQTHVTGGRTWIYNGRQWSAQSNAATSSSTVSSTAPASPYVGDLWLQSETGDLYVYALGGWVQLGGLPGEMGPSGPAGQSVTNAYVWFAG